MKPPSNISSYLSILAVDQPDNDAVIMALGKGRYEKVSYLELEQLSNQLALGFLDLGVKKGTRVVVMVKPSLEFFSIVFALFKIGAVVVAVDPGMGMKNLGECLKEAEPTVFIGTPTAHLARSIFRWASKTLSLNIIVGNKFISGKISLDAVRERGEKSTGHIIIETTASDMAAILFTSGSTGVPKGAVYNHGNFIAQVEMLRETYDIKPGEIDLATFPLFALFAPALGMTSIIPIMDFTHPGNVNPENIIEPINKFKATTMFGSPALLDRVGRYGEINNVKLNSLNRVLSAGAPVSHAILNRYQKLLRDDVEIYTPYGATESLPVSSIGSKEVLNETGLLSDKGKGTCVGMPVSNIDVKIIKITDVPIPNWDDSLLVDTNTIGEIIVKGDQVTALYFNRFRSTELAKMYCSDGGFYHRMGDLGYLDETGRLWFCGRKSERVVLKEETLFTTQCEGVFNQHKYVKRTALVGITEGDHTKPVICIEAEKGIDHEALMNELSIQGNSFVHTRLIKDFLFHPGFPVDVRHNAKINRQSLSLWAGKQLR
jgi:acyl-CoA synthetase (AMP-forming)/AMP-acid ligase II